MPTTGNDTLFGGAGNDTIDALAGDDSVSGQGGNDSLIGNDGNDTLSGDAGNDRLFGGDGDDSLLGGDGDDRLFGDFGNDFVAGGIGNDSLSGSLGIDTVSYADATASVTVSLEGFGFATGGSGNDTVNDFEVVIGSSFPDSILGNNDTLPGDRLIGGDGGDTLRGLAGNDTLVGGRGGDLLDGGAGAADWASYFDATSAVTIFLGSPASGGGDALGDTFVDIEFFELSNGFGDTWIGGAGSDFVFGHGGNDVLFGGGAYDALYGGAGDDFLLGGDTGDLLDGGTGGFDVVFYGDSPVGISINLVTAIHSGFAAGDTMVGIEGYLLTEQGDTMTGLDSAGLGEVIYGLGGADSLVGLGGFDYLIGGDGADTLVGGFGWDLLIGGAGADRFVWNSGGEGGPALGGGGGGDVVQDFQAGVDKLAFVSASTGISGFTLGANLFIQASGTTPISGLQGSGSGPTLIYDTQFGGLWYDTNGNAAGGLIYLATVVGAPTLTATDFMVI